MKNLHETIIKVAESVTGSNQSFHFDGQFELIKFVEAVFEELYLPTDIAETIHNRYPKDTLDALYEVWNKLPPCNLLDVIGGAIQDIQYHQGIRKSESKI